MWDSIILILGVKVITFTPRVISLMVISFFLPQKLNKVILRMRA
jgi:branched-subunit amino acid transport protein